MRLFRGEPAVEGVAEPGGCRAHIAAGMSRGDVELGGGGAHIAAGMCRGDVELISLQV